MRNKVPEAVSTNSGVGVQVRTRHIHSLLFICSFAFCMRLIAFGMVQPWPINEGSPFWKSGAEVVNIAASIASHRGFGSPFGIPSGPTAWIPPVYPYIVSTIFIEYGLGPAENANERQRYRALGEISNLAERRTEAIDFISEHRIQFLRQVFYRVRYWWFAEAESARIFTPYRLLAMVSLVGMALALRTISKGSALTIVAAMIVYPLVYYLTDVFARYRYPIEPLMMVLTGFAASQMLSSGKKKIGKFNR
jgi:hypothetical protein